MLPPHLIYSMSLISFMEQQILPISQNRFKTQFHSYSYNDFLRRLPICKNTFYFQNEQILAKNPKLYHVSNNHKKTVANIFSKSYRNSEL